MMRPLAGCGVVITRPASQAGALAQAVEAAGGTPFLYPVLEILDTGDVGPLLAAAAALEQYDLAVFISPNAVMRAMNQILARRDWPASLRAAAIGRGSVKELRRFGIADVIAPARQYDSEHLLALPEMQAVQGLRVVIFRGDGGRELLGDTLRARGATVNYVECYRRARPAADAGPLLRAWARGEVHAVVITSSEGLRNLFEMVGKLGQSWLRRTLLVATHPRIAAVARELGCQRIEESDPGDDAIVATLLRVFAAGDEKD
jgi:uroporphyrinogen-III synthase